MKKMKGRNQNGEPKLVPARRRLLRGRPLKNTNEEGARKKTLDQEEEGEEGEKNVGCTDEVGARKKKGFFLSLLTFDF